MDRKELVATINKNRLIKAATPIIDDEIDRNKSVANTAPDMIPFAANSLNGI